MRGGLATVQTRHLFCHHAADISVNPDMGDESVLDFDKVAALPMVADFSRVHGVRSFPVGPIASFEELFAAGVVFATDGGALVRFERPVLTDGHVPDPDSLDEIYLDRTYALSTGLEVGDTLRWRLLPDEVLGLAFNVLEAGDLEGALAILNDPTAGTTVELRVAGIGTGLEGARQRAGDGPLPPVALG